MPVTEVTGTDAWVFPKAERDFEFGMENLCLAETKKITDVTAKYSKGCK